MEKVKKTKSKIISLIVFLCVALIAGTGTSLAYFTDVKEYESVYSAGNVKIELTEAEVKQDGSGNYVLDDTKPRLQAGEIEENTIHTYGRLFPGLNIHKDPTVKNTGSEDAWIAMKIIITDGVGDIHKIFGYQGSPDIDIELLLQGGLLDKQVIVDTWNGIYDVCVAKDGSYAMAQIATDGVYEFYFFMLNPKQTGEEVMIFDTLVVNPYLENVHMQELVELKIEVQAFAVQTFGFSSCYDAMQGAFSSHFEKCR